LRRSAGFLRRYEIVITGTRFFSQDHSNASGVMSLKTMRMSVSPLRTKVLASGPPRKAR
jgi:hypothetical protein